MPSTIHELCSPCCITMSLRGSVSYTCSIYIFMSPRRVMVIPNQCFMLWGSSANETIFCTFLALTHFVTTGDDTFKWWKHSFCNRETILLFQTAPATRFVICSTSIAMRNLCGWNKKQPQTSKKKQKPLSVLNSEFTH